MNEIMATAENQIVDYKAKATEWLQNMGTQLPPQQAVQFLELCQAYKLNPFKREIYAVGYGNKFNIITGYEVYLKRAERTGKLDGWKCVTNVDNSMAKVTIYRKDWKYPFEHEVLMSEVRQNSPIWQKMPVFMMKKVCMEQGFRLCFPDEMGGMPYAEEEVSYDRVIQAEEVDITPEAERVEEPQKKSQNPDRIRLRQILDKFGDKMDDKPYEMCCQAMAGDDDNAVTDMLNRSIAYFGRKGIQVA